MEIERRVFDMDEIHVEKRSDGEKRMISGHAAVFNTPSDPRIGWIERIEPRAFDDVLDQDIRALINHKEDLILGRTKSGTLRLSIDERGLSYEIDMPDTTAARDLMVSIDRGDITQSSFTFKVADGGQKWSMDKEGRSLRTISKFLYVLDVSPVTFPGYPDTDVAKRSLDMWMKENETTKIIPVSVRERELMLADY